MKAKIHPSLKYCDICKSKVIETTKETIEYQCGYKIKIDLKEIKTNKINNCNNKILISKDGINIEELRDRFNILIENGINYKIKIGIDQKKEIHYMIIKDDYVELN